MEIQIKDGKIFAPLKEKVVGPKTRRGSTSEIYHSFG